MIGVEMIGYIALDEFRELLGGNPSRQYANKVIKSQNMEAHTGTFINSQDAHEYLQARWRRELARKMGATVKTLVDHDDWDVPEGCPECGAFAIWKPATPEEIQNLDLPVYQEGWGWACIKGHKGG